MVDHGTSDVLYLEARITYRFIRNKFLKGRSSIAFYCDRSTKKLFCIRLVVYCFLKVLVTIVFIVR